MVPPQVAHRQVTASIPGLCGSKSAGSGRPHRAARSAYEPITSTWPGSLSHTHTGSGVPQKRSRESAQSTLFSSHSPKRPAPISGGCQAMPRFSSSSRSRMAVVRTNHDSRG